MKEERRGVLWDVGNVLVRYHENRGLYHLSGELSWQNGQPLNQAEVATVMGVARREVWPASGVANVEDHTVEQDFRSSLNRQGAILAEGKSGGEALYLALTECFEPMQERLLLLAKLQRAGVFVALITDTVRWHWQRITRLCPALSLVPSIRSYDVKCRKEHGAEIYRLALARLGIPANQVCNLVMVDDRAENLRGAEEAGIRGLHVQPGDDLAALLEAEGIISLQQPARMPAWMTA